jgi:hypothetical protein
MNKTAKAAIAAAMAGYEGRPPGDETEAEAPTTAQPAKAPDQGPDATVGINAATPELGITKDTTHRALMPEAKGVALEAGLGDNPQALLKVASEMAKFNEGAAAARALVGKLVEAPAERIKFEEGASAARRLLDIAIAAPAEMLKFNAGAAAARRLLGHVVGGNTELAKFNIGQAAARRLLGKPERPSANI